MVEAWDVGYKTQIFLSQISLLPERDGKSTFLFCSYSSALQKRKASFIRIYRIATWGRRREGKKEAVWKVPEDGEPTVLQNSPVTSVEKWTIGLHCSDKAGQRLQFSCRN